MQPTETVPPRILETAIYVDDLDAAERFYGGLLGLEKVGRVGDRHIFYRCGQGMLLVFNPELTVLPPQNEALPVPPHGAIGQGHMCFGSGAAQLDALVALFDRSDIAIEADFRWPNGARSIYVRDPAGNSIEFAEPRLWDFGE
jgi:catechol 2,3-dioxygenase-like lactoylglutathione lyase family enzyme